MSLDPSPANACAERLCIVMPAHDEGEQLREVIREWIDELERLGLDYCIRVYDDGSDDDTGRIAEDLAGANPRIVASRHANRGHGPTILRGYREARTDWVFQVDSDGELPASAFEALWSRRGSHDLLLGARTGRVSRPTRRLVSFGCRVAVRALFGSEVSDVNTPYRLVRGARLRQLLEWIPDDAFAPNVLLSGLAAQAGLRILEVPVETRGGRAGLRGRALFRGVLSSMRDTLSTRLRVRWSRR